MRPTIEYLKTKFAEYNDRLFAGALPMPKFTLTTAKRRAGFTRYSVKKDSKGNKTYSNFLIGISVLYDLSEEEFVDTLVHEMIHYYIAYHHIEDTSTHGVEYCRIMNRIVKEHGVKVSLSFAPSEEELATNLRPSWHYLCLFRNTKGQKCLAVVARTRLFLLWHAFDVCSQAGNCQWYASSDSFFDKFRKSITPKYYIVDDLDVESHLENAYYLVHEGHVIRPVKRK